MVQQVYKYDLTVQDEMIVMLPRGARVLTVAAQRDVLCLWALVDPEARVEPRRFRVAGTGHDVHGPTDRYCGTAHLYDGALVFHVFEHSV